jgi:hypothetical protein
MTNADNVSCPHNILSDSSGDVISTTQIQFKQVGWAAPGKLGIAAVCGRQDCAGAHACLNLPARRPGRARRQAEDIAGKLDEPHIKSAAPDDQMQVAGMWVVLAISVGVALTIFMINICIGKKAAQATTAALVQEASSSAKRRRSPLAPQQTSP